MEKRILKFPKEGLKQLQFFMEGISFPVAVAAYTEQDEGAAPPAPVACTPPF